MEKAKKYMNKLFKKISISIKRSWRKLKYLDKTQLNYFIVTSFIGLFCVFTATTYSLFTVTKYLNAAVITIAKLNYTLSSSTSGYSNGSITVDAGKTLAVDLTLTSSNSFKTKYALNYNTSATDVSVYYSQNLKNNMVGTVGTSGSSINMRVVIVNDGSTSATINFTIAGGYTQNSLTSNISSGYYEQDITIRTVLYDENFANPTSASSFPDQNNYAYYKTECTESANPVWDNDINTLNLGNLTKQNSCDVYFKKITSDIEIYFNLTDSAGNSTFTKDAPPKDGSYTFTGATCNSNATATWNSDSWNLSVTGIDAKTLCVATFTAN